MSSSQILLLGLIAGGTIFLGLPLGRIPNPSLRLRAALNALAAGILLFLLWDVLAHAVEPVEYALDAAVDGTGSWGRFAWLASLLTGGVAVGLMSLVYYERWLRNRRAHPTRHGGHHSEAATLALLIATGIGLHNLAEGLAIGQSAASGDTSLAVVLVIGFALHNSTEGFGIVAPLAGEKPPPTTRFLLLLGVIGGGPTLVGTLIGQGWTSEALSILFLSLAAGSILYVLLELIGLNRGFEEKPLVTWALFAGLFLGFATDFVLGAVGG